MKQCEKELAAYYRGKIEEAARELGPAPSLPRNALRPAPPQRGLGSRAEFLAGLAAAALACSCALAGSIPSPGRSYFAAAARSISSIKLDEARVSDFLRALGSPFAASRNAVPGKL